MSMTLVRKSAMVLGPVIAAAMLMGASPGKVAICHKGTPIEVGIAATVAHLLHGDSLGDCSPPPPCQGSGTCFL
jgi:hypothetical protein